MRILNRLFRRREPGTFRLQDGSYFALTTCYAQWPINGLGAAHPLWQSFCGGRITGSGFYRLCADGVQRRCYYATFDPRGLFHPCSNPPNVIVEERNIRLVTEAQFYDLVPDRRTHSVVCRKTKVTDRLVAV